MRGWTIGTITPAYPEDGLIEDIRRYHRAMEPALERLVAIHSTWGGPLVLEGWALYPAHVRPWLGGSVFGIWLVAGEGLLESRLRRRPGFLDGAAAENYLRRSKWHNRRLLEECGRWPCPSCRSGKEIRRRR